MSKNTTAYDDIIHLPHHVSLTRPQMSMHDRAAQFAPFRALTGHGDAISETERLTERRPELTEDARAELDRKYRLLMAHIAEQPEVIITYFVPDPHKQGGALRTVTGRIKKLDAYGRSIVMLDGSVIPMDETVELAAAMLNDD